MSSGGWRKTGDWPQLAGIEMAADIVPIAFALNASDYTDFSPKADEAPVPVKNGNLNRQNSLVNR